MQLTKFNLPFALSILLLANLPGRAFTLIPISATLAPKGYGVATSFRVENESSNRIAFQVSIVTRDMDEHGQETYLPATNLFTVFPPQGIIAPGQNQNLRLVWKGPANLTNELAFRIIAEELPVAFAQESKESQIKLLVRYMGTVYVRPAKAKPLLQTVSLVKAADNSSTTNLYELTLLNSGNAHQGLKNPTLKITAAPGQETSLTNSQLNTVEGQNVLAHHTRRFSVALPADLTAPVYPALLMVDE